MKAILHTYILVLFLFKNRKVRLSMAADQLILSSRIYMLLFADIALKYDIKRNTRDFCIASIP